MEQSESNIARWRIFFDQDFSPERQKKRAKAIVIKQLRQKVMHTEFLLAVCHGGDINLFRKCNSSISKGRLVTLSECHGIA